ncbi:MAG: aconitate hydratase [Deltaproteobacteria bacterium]|nr:aconitate hydratase [Deltaproteobacteria bacterium]
MKHPFTRGKAEAVLSEKRKVLGRGLSYAEKILFLHQAESARNKPLVRGKDQLSLHPDRVAMQDATAQMAMLQFMQSGRDRTRVDASIHCDHLLRADKGNGEDLDAALTANREVYDFLASAAARYGIEFWKPGSGIIHQVLLENHAIPGGLMIGTDSHTPNAGGLGMIAIGVGGADAAEVMAGMPWETRHPELVGVRLEGELTGWASAKDVILKLLDQLTVKGGTGKIFEYFGEGARTLSATQKATIANMGAELGATSSVFVYDAAMDAYLKNVGRDAGAEWANGMASILCQDDICGQEPERVFNAFIELNLGEVKPAHAGPFSPDRVTNVSGMKELIQSENLPEPVSAVLLGSCTNSSYSDLHAAAQVLSQAGAKGVKPQVPLMLSPGSRRIYETIKRDGILDQLLAAGAILLTASCGPCIGQWDRRDVPKGVPNCLFTTFNRNFRGRNDANPETRAFLTSPAVAAALAVSGKAGFDPETDSLTGSDGDLFRLDPPPPPALPAAGLAHAGDACVPAGDGGQSVEIRISPNSERLERLSPFAPWDGNDFLDLPILVKTRGKTTTDHISPGGKWLRYRGHLTNISRNLLEGAVNAFTGEAGHGTNIFTGERGVKFSDLADAYREKAGGFVIVGDENYGEGSSREHAAMSPRFLGARAVIARSFARIHEANLKKQGVLPLVFSDSTHYDGVGEFDRISLTGLSGIAPDRPVSGVVVREDGSKTEYSFNHTLTREQIGWFRAGSALNALKDAHLRT